MWARAKLKLKTEFYNTVRDSAIYWVPANFVNFTFFPSYLRQLGWMFFSVIWNCYLSLAQHRATELPAQTQQKSNQIKSPAYPKFDPFAEDRSRFQT